MRRRSWVFILFCLFTVSLLFSQLTNADVALRVDEAATRFLLEQGRTGAALVVENPLGRDLPARLRVELIDPQGVVRAHNERDEIIKQGAATLFIPLPFKFTDLKDAERKEFLWYRLRYQIIPRDSASGTVPLAAGFISLSRIAPDIFEVRISASEYGREGARYRAQLRAVHPISGNGIEGVSVEATVKVEGDTEEQSVILKASGITGREGYTTLDFALPGRIKAEGADIKVTARRGILVQEAADTINFDHITRIFISTDKPLYQPGQTLHARALIFSPSMQALSGEEMPFKITDPEGTIVYRARLKTSRFGAASADWVIPENTRLGEYTVSFGRDDASYAFYRVKISRYDLPNFMANVKPDRPFYLPGQNAAVEVSAAYLFGQPVKRGRVRVVREREREWNYREQKWEVKEEEAYEGEADAEGRFVAHVNLEKAHEDLKDSSWSHFSDVTYAAYFTDTSTGRTEQRRFDLRATKEPIHVYVTGDTYGQSSGLPMEFYVSTFYADGTPAQCELSINKGSDDDKATVPPKTKVPGRRVASLTTNSYGLAKVSNLRPPRDEGSNRVHLRFSARDRKNAVGHRNESFYYQDTPAIRVTTGKSLYSPREPLDIQLVSTEKDVNVIVDVSKDMQVIHSEMVRLRDGRASLTLPYDEQFRNEVKIIAYADIAPREYIRDSHIVLYPHDRDLKLEVLPGKQSYRPGEEAHVNFNVAAGGKAMESALGVVIFDRAVEERARTDQEFGSGYSLYGNYAGLLGWQDSLAGVTKKSLERLDLSKLPTPDLYLLAEILLNRQGYYAPSVFSGINYELDQATTFSKLVTAQIKPALDALKARYLKSNEHPSDEASLRRILSEAGINFDQLLDPWGNPYRALFSIKNERDVLKIVSAGADKRFETADDFTPAIESWLYFKPVGEAIDRAVNNYHTRTRGYIRDSATLRAELLREGINLDTLRDRWGQPYALKFDIAGAYYDINVESGGANGLFDNQLNSALNSLTSRERDDFLIWTSRIEYFAERRAEIDAALTIYLQKTRSFPQDMKGLRAALSAAKIDFDSLRDPWGRAYYATFRKESRYTDRVSVVSRSQYGEAAKTRSQIKPVTQKLGIVHLRSAGADGREGTRDDFDAGIFTLVISEHGKREASKRLKQKRAPIILTGSGGAISGTVIDSTGAVIPGVTVTATLLATEQTYTTTTDDNGRYLLRNLPPATYEVQLQAPGFQVTVVENVRVTKSNILTLDLTLQAGTVTETVTVTSEANATLETLSATRGRQQISNFQLDGVNTKDILALQGGAADVLTKAGSVNATPRLREYFPETLVWQPLLETDAQGRASLSFKLADNITTWKMAVIGSTASGEIGMAEKEILAFQPFFVEHDPPRILTEGDEIQLPVVLRNYLGKAQSVDLEIKPESWFTLLGSPKSRAEVAPGDNARRTFDFRAVASIKDGKQRITATGAEVADQIEKPVSVHPDGEEVAQTESGILGDSALIEANIPANVIKGTERAELKIYPGLMAHVVESIEGIMARPYGCAEQTISSAYPSLLALRSSRHTKLEPSVAAKARRYVQAGYERLLNYRAASGGFSYWGRGDADLALTAYALRFLHEAQAFIEIDESVLREARQWLFKQQRADGSWQPPHMQWEKVEDKRRAAFLTAFVARILSLTDKKEAADKTTGDDQTRAETPSSLKRALSFLAERYKEIDEPYLIASYALVSYATGEMERAREAVMKLRTLAHEEAGAAYWALETNTPFYGWGLAGRIETTALALQALNKYCETQNAGCGLKDTAKDRASTFSQLIDRGLLFLLRNQDRYGVWYSTQATVNTLDALVTLLANDSPDSSKGTQAQIFVNGKLATTLELPPGNQLSTPVLADISRFVSPGSNRIEIRRGANAARASVQVVTTYYVPWSGRKIANHADKGDSARSLRLGVSYDKSAGRAGEEITCKVEAERIGHRGYGMLLAEIGLPPGADVDRASLELAMKESGWTFSQYDILPDRLIVYLWPQAGGTNFVFKFRPRFGLKAQTAHSVLYDYYNPEARVVVAPTRFTIR